MLFNTISACRCLKSLSERPQLVAVQLSFIQALQEALLSKLGLKEGFDIAASNLHKIVAGFPAFLERNLFLQLISGFARMKSRLYSIAHVSVYSPLQYYL